MDVGIILVNVIMGILVGNQNDKKMEHQMETGV